MTNSIEGSLQITFLCLFQVLTLVSMATESEKYRNWAMCYKCAINPGQLAVVTAILNNRGVFAVLQTGFGTSLFFSCLYSYSQLLPNESSIILVLAISTKMLQNIRKP